MITKHVIKDSTWDCGISKFNQIKNMLQHDGFAIVDYTIDYNHGATLRHEFAATITSRPAKVIGIEQVMIRKTEEKQ